ncbi:unnamed protein product [Lampetra planeri]
MASQERLYELWMLYFTKKDPAFLRQWLEIFVVTHEASTLDQDVILMRGDPRPPDLSVLPASFLQVSSQQLVQCVHKLSVCLDDEHLSLALLIIKALIALCRNVQNVEDIGACSYTSHVITLATMCIQQSKEQTKQREVSGELSLETFALHSLHFCQRLYDPYQNWARRVAGDAVSAMERSRQRFKAAPLINEFVPFFYQCFQEYTHLPGKLTDQLLHLFGAVIAGNQRNALQAISPATLEVLMRLLVDPAMAGSSGSVARGRLGLTLKCLTEMVQALHTGSPDQRQVEVASVLDGYFKVLNAEGVTTPGSLAWNDGLVELQMHMLRSIPEMLACSDRPVLQASFLNSNCFEHLTRLLHNSKLLLSARAKAPGKSEKELANSKLQLEQGPGKRTDALTVLTIRVLTCVMHTSPAAKEVFKERIGYNHLFDLLQSLGQPSLALLYELLDMAVEGDHRQALSGASRMYGGGGGGGVANVQALLMLVRWLPTLESLSARSYLAAALHQLCCADRPSRTVCVNAGMMSCILDSLQMVDPVRHMDCAVSLVGLLEALGSQSIRAKELFCLFRLLRRRWSSTDGFNAEAAAVHPLTGTVTRALSAMARRDGVERAMHYFDLTHAMAGITVPAVQRWPGSGFSFHAWFCLDATEQRLAHLAGGKRKQLYSFFTSSGTGFEAFVTGAGVLVVAVCTKKEYVTVSLPDTCFHDSAWHCVAVVHTTARRALFSQCIVNIYVNGQLRDTAPLKFPPMGEAFTSCCIGSAGNRTITPTPSQIPEPTSFFPGSPPHSTSSTSSFPTSPSSHGVTAIPSPISASSSSVLDGSPTRPSAFPGAGLPRLSSSSGVPRLAPGTAPCLRTIPAGTQDSEWGSPTSLRGQLGSVSVFHDALQPPQVKALHQAGPNNLFPFKPPECAPELTDLPAKMLLYYTPKACQKLLCLDLAPSHLFDGRLTGQTVVNWDIKDVIHCMGGMAVLVPLLEQLVSTECPAAQQDDGGAFSSPARTSEARLEGSHVACFLLLLRNFVRNHPANQESLAQSQGMATVGALILQSGKRHMDASVLTACQLLVEAVIDSNALLLHQAYQALLFDFRLWSQADFPVRIGHIQYLSTIIKDNHKQFRRRYGVQFLLDVVRTYYGSRSSELCADDLRVIRAAIFGLIKYYITKEVSSDEVQSIINFLASVGEEEQINACLDMLLALLRSKGPSPSYEQLVLLLTEAGQCEGLYSLLLLQRKHSDVLREKLFRLFLRLLRSERIGEKSKQRLRLRDGLFAGLVALQADVPVTLTVVRGMLLIIVTADTSPNYQDIMAVVHFSRKADLSVRHAVCKKVFDLVYNSHDAIQQIARCTGWQDTLVRLLAWESNPNAQAGDTASPTDATPPLGVAVIPEGEVATRADGDKVPRGHHKAKLDGESDSLASLSYQPHTPFRDSPFDLTLDSPLPEGACAHGAPPGSRGSFGAGAPAAGGGGGGSGSVPSTPSPLDTWKPFPGSVSRQESSLSDAFDESLLNEEFFSHVEQSVPVEEDLCDLLVSVLFSAMWHGVEGSDESAWRERGQVFTALTKLGSRCLLLRPPSHIKRCLLELMLEACVSDVRDAALASLPGLADNALRLLRLVQDLLITEGQACPEFWSLKVMEGLVTLLDTLSARQASLGTPLDLSETTHISQRLLLGFIAHSDTQVCATAAAKLHTLLQTRPLSGREEAGYLLGRLDDALSRSAPEHGARHRAAFDTHPPVDSFVVPMLHALLERCHKLLALAEHLPGLPAPNGSPTCLDDFQVYCRSTEWRLFVDIVVLPLMNQFEMERFAKGHDRMSCFWNSCFDALMGSSCRRDRLRNESQRKFQDQVMEPFRRRTRGESARFNSSLKTQAAQLTASLRQWCLTRRYLSSERGPWADPEASPIHWRLASAETDSDMRLKLEPNLSFRTHRESSALRDNHGAQQVSVPADSLSLVVVKEAKVDEVDEDKLEDEEDIAPVAPLGTGEGEQSQKEKLVLAEECQLIKMVDAVPGRLELTTHHVYFYDLSGDKEEGMGLDFKCPLWQLREVHLRRYNLRRSALEIFFIDQTSYFLNFTKEVRNRVYSRIVGLRPPNLVYYGSRSPQELLKASGITQKWVNREISNFEYLMKLNTIAGRTYNDLAQYPVFPWVLSDYTSDELDLSNPGVFRDLSKPIGIVSERNAKEVKDRYENFEDTTGTTGKFHYGTHYSNAAGVMHYMIRVEPLTTLHIQLQSGRFDCADRQFHSIPATWQALMDSPNDVKELIPEFFYFPEFLENQNGFNLGTLQMSRETVNNVVLPRWAKSPDDFIRKHRAALESEFVSAHLHEWIDLIFGYKQRGPAAVEAHNVFYYCTYEGAVDVDAIENEMERKAVEGMISNFGQTPCQLLKEPHPSRLSAVSALRALSRTDTFTMNLFLNTSELKTFFEEGISDDIPIVKAVVPRNQPRSFISQGGLETLVTVSANSLVGAHGWLPYNKNISNYFTFSRDPSVASIKTQRYITGPLAPGLEASCRLYAVSLDGKLLFSAGNWDNSVRATSLGKARPVAHYTRHIDIVTCLALDGCGIHLVTGSRDTTCMVWQLLYQGGICVGLIPKPLQVLYGHTAEVLCVAISTELDMAVSGAKDGMVMVHTVQRGQYMRCLRPPCESSLPLSVPALALSCEGHVVVYSTLEAKASLKDKHTLHVYSVNGRHLASQGLYEQLTDLCVAGDHVVLGSMQCNLSIRHLHSLEEVTSLAMRVPVHCVSVTKERSHVLVGLADGKLIFVGVGRAPEIRSGQLRKLWGSTKRMSQVSAGETRYNPS